MDCPRFVDLVDLVEDKLSAADRQKIEAHMVDGCPRCTESVAWLRQMLPRLAAIDAPMPPAAVLSRAKGIFADQRRKLPNRERQLAFLRFDSSQRRLAAGLRQTGRVSQQLLYGVDTMDVDIQVERAAGQTWRLIGQLMSTVDRREQIVGAQVALRNAERVVLGEVVDDWGEFVIRNVAPGLYDLEISLVDRDIVIRNLRVGET